MESCMVSVIIPTYKRSDRLLEAVNSVLTQSYPNIEVIVVDDNDSDSEYRDKTESIMKKFENNKRVIYIKHHKNLNGAAARNTGIRHSRGKIICFLDDDDIFKKDKVEKQLKYLLKTNFKAVYCGRVKGEKAICCDLEGDLSKQLLLLEFSPTSSTLMFYKEVLTELKGFDESYRRHQDFELLLRFFDKKYEIGVVNEALVITGINIGENQLQGLALENMKINFLSQFDDVIERIDLEENGFRAKVYVRHYISIFISYIKDKKLLSVLRIYLKMIRHYPLSFNKQLIKRILRYDL